MQTTLFRASTKGMLDFKEKIQAASATGIEKALKEMEFALMDKDAEINAKDEKIKQLLRKYDNDLDELEELREKHSKNKRKIESLEEKVEELEEELKEKPFGAETIVDELKIDLLKRAYKKCTLEELELMLTLQIN